jgi:hypothetical protein
MYKLSKLKSNRRSIYLGLAGVLLGVGIGCGGVPAESGNEGATGDPGRAVLPDTSGQADVIGEVAEEGSALGSAFVGDYAKSPGGLVHRSCVHAVAEGELVIDDSAGGESRVVGADGRRRSVPACAASAGAPDSEGNTADEPAPLPTGWVVDGEGTAPAVVHYLHADTTVPKFPGGDTGQTIYLFPGLTDSAGTAIFQPVLQYGPSPAGGGSYWAIASWLVKKNNDHWHSPLKRVSPGDHIYGSIFASNCSGNVCDWTVWTANTTRGYSTKLQIKTGYQFKRVIGDALEVYDLLSCDHLPMSASTSTKIFASNAAGSKMYVPLRMERWSTDCSARAGVGSADGWVALHWNGL